MLKIIYFCVLSPYYILIDFALKFELFINDSTYEIDIYENKKNLKYWLFVWVESKLQFVIGGERGFKKMFEENGRELVWTFFVDKQDGARLKLLDKYVKVLRSLGVVDDVL